MGPRVFTVREANALIPKFEEAFAEFDQIRERLRKIKAKMDVLEMLWGEEINSESTPDYREYQHYLKDVAEAKGQFETVTRRFAEMEVVLKSVESGLVDLYGVIESRLVFLCWRRGEKSLEYYHHLEDGFAGRREIAAQPKLE